MITLNCDLGESFGYWHMGQDSDIMPYINQANIACGFHASDPLTMQKTIALAVKHNVIIGAHPGYPDLVGFGRRSMVIASSELKAIVQYQIGALEGLCQAQKTHVQYVKPHGALYNDMMANDDIFNTLCLAIAELSSALDRPISLVIQATMQNEHYQTLASHFGISLSFEAFADRNYQDNGLLVPRSQANAVISKPEHVVNRIKQFIEQQRLTSEHGKPLCLQADTLCVHGDTTNAVTLVKQLHQLITHSEIGQ